MLHGCANMHAHTSTLFLSSFTLQRQAINSNCLSVCTCRDWESFQIYTFCSSPPVRNRWKNSDLSIQRYTMRPQTLNKDSSEAVHQWVPIHKNLHERLLSKKSRSACEKLSKRHEGVQRWGQPRIQRTTNSEESEDEWMVPCLLKQSDRFILTSKINAEWYTPNRAKSLSSGNRITRGVYFWG